MATGFYFDERVLWHSAGHHVLVQPVSEWVEPSETAGLAESPATKRRLVNLLNVSGLMAKLEGRTAEPLARHQLERVHTPDYLDKLITLSEGAGGDVGRAAVVGPRSFDIARLAAGLVTQATLDVYDGKLDNAYALTRPPGHHALPDQGMGFCLLCNVALAIEELIEARGAQRVAVIDWDVHFGNGTEAVFYNRPDVLTISLHQKDWVPWGGHADRHGEGDGEGYNINVPLIAGSGHAAYMDAFELIVEPAINRFKPDMILVACGFDASGFDPLSRMLAYSETFRAMTKRTMALADKHCGGKLVLAHEGGYSEGYVPFCGLATIEELSGIRTDVEDAELPRFETAQPGREFEALQRAELVKLAGTYPLLR